MRSDHHIFLPLTVLALCLQLSWAGIWNAAEKPGWCPDAPDCVGKRDLNQCSTDATCNGGLKCCVACGRKCIKPVFEIPNLKDPLAAKIISLEEEGGGHGK
ncbi:WAP four-disulfide core domain protein 18-like [Pleurodeles waltl]|uniref:WAP four-disulfide core domain protein 18-like n=1 Tax=Pleurodeles waltl TaxID=8319 RepID=UPI003709BD83